ncbi:hypothetical protein [Streptomyces qinzhouensis]|uniref:Uncharacterized protein n=1 Tax=Streptomyces qinzhouensis TaxID=2599401 RepID=A0A5B8J8T4_9ACTN|nr:hypothetical protein [Streptomyces qinzhouensis]QDY77676.1 hypothetical protein FQU76_15390 [Streptomyces qinzhouensis]
MSTHDEPTVSLVTVDRETASIILSRSDGKEAHFPLSPSFFAASSTLSRLHVPLSLNVLIASTLSGDDILFELPQYDAPTGQLGGRLVVYLDQNKWSEIGNALHAPSKVSDSSRRAAEKLAQWVKEGRIILPASAGHHNETTKRFDTRKRYSLGLTVLQYSRGWQMRHPLQVRRNELHDSFCHRSGQLAKVRSAPVFTLAPDALYSTAQRGMRHYSAPADFEPPLAFTTEALVTATSSIDVMLDTERIEPGPKTSWAEVNQRFSDWLDEQDIDSQQKRKHIDAFFLTDIQKEVAEEAHSAALAIDDLSRWFLREAIGDIRRFPALGLFREMLHNRHLNKGTRWRLNDLTDMMYLSCAAGYADFVVCERHMRDPLAHGLRRLGLKTPVYRHLAEAVDAIEETLTEP